MKKCIAELIDELLRIEPEGGPVSSLTLAIATANLNTRFRDRGLSSREMWFQRDQFTNCQLPISDLDLIRQQHSHRIYNHAASQKSKAPRGKHPSVPTIQVGDLVYIISDGSKTRARDRYLVVSIDGSWCNVRKFTGSQLRSTSYRVKLAECFRVYDKSPPPPLPTLQSPRESTSTLVPQLPPPVPVELSQPRMHDTNPQIPPRALNIPYPPLEMMEGVPERPTYSEHPEPDQQTAHVPDSLSSPLTAGTTFENHTAPRRSSRQRRPPAHLKDFVI